MKNDIEPSQKEALKQAFKTALEALSGKIAGLRSIEVGLNANAEEAFDIALTTTFDNFDDLHFYANHPDHLAAAAIIKEAKEARACVDYIF